MEDRRKSKRLDLEVAVQFKRLDKGEVTTISYIHVKVTDMSRSGIGFSAEHELEVGSYYDTKIRIWTGETIDAVVEIVRVGEEEGIYQYGAVFIGMTEADALKIDIYRMFNEE